MQACKGDYSNFGQPILKRLTCKDHVAVTAFGVVNVRWGGGGGGGETHCFYDSQYRITHLHLIAQYLQLALCYDAPKVCGFVFTNSRKSMFPSENHVVTMKHK